MDIVLGSYPRNMRAIGMVGPFTNKADHGAVALTLLGMNGSGLLGLLLKAALYVRVKFGQAVLVR